MEDYGGHSRDRTLTEVLVIPLIGIFFISPFLAIGSGLVIVGALSLMRGPDIDDLIICLPAGVLLNGIACGCLYYAFVHIPGVTVRYFKLVGSSFEYATARKGPTFCEIESIVEIRENRSRRKPPGRKARGWWLHHAGHGWIYLDRSTENAERLIGTISGKGTRRA